MSFSSSALHSWFWFFAFFTERSSVFVLREKVFGSCFSFSVLVLREKAGFQFLFFVKKQVFSSCSLRFLVFVLREKAGD
ncbi:hypothetical protein RhiirC2_791044 [Rhizophagus irregularis]|uniref:Secreted protein n=1 Tax=Rhizophagus irregularis TaxID=588596 RepID=A0A2N1MK53_9GLOM|nr:hypothetical protein RhiirC2_791044 [Rhizophagus irregularis]